MTYSDEKLAAMNGVEIRNLYANCQRHDTDDARIILDQIEKLDLLSRPVEALRSSDPIFLKIEEIVNRSDSRAKIIAAVEQGVPGLAGVEPDIVAELGDSYSGHDWGTVNAGWIVGQLMYSMGYKKGKSAKMPPGSVAKSAATWSPKGKLI